MGSTLAYLRASVVALWDLAHAIPTSKVVRDFGDISTDNRRVITRQWVAEALTMWFVVPLCALDARLSRRSGSFAERNPVGLLE